MFEHPNLTVQSKNCVSNNRTRHLIPPKLYLLQKESPFPEQSFNVPKRAILTIQG